jgi:pimeloyl-ACP methyl ester carboxylesterase
VIEERWFRASDGVATGARIAGERGDALIFVHGVGSTAAIWDRQLAAFGDTYRCAAVELRGNGMPKPEADPMTITREGFVRDVLAVAGELGVERFTLVGCSLGGVVGFELMRHAPQRVAALAIVGSFAAYPNGQAYADGILAAVGDAGTMRDFAQARAAKMGLPPARVAETIEQMAVKSVASYRASTQATWTGDYRADLATMRVPALVLYGEHDTIAPKALSEEIARGIPEAEIAVVPGAGHVANADRPDDFNALLRPFLRRVSRS